MGEDKFVFGQILRKCTINKKAITNGQVEVTDRHAPKQLPMPHTIYLNAVKARIILVAALLDNIQHERGGRTHFARGIDAMTAAAATGGRREGSAHAGSETAGPTMVQMR